MKTDQITLFYDGLCPLCSREIDHYIKLDKNSILKVIDISRSDFDPKIHSLEDKNFHKNFHVMKDGVFFEGVDAFYEIWRALGIFSFMQFIYKTKVGNASMNFGYLVFSNIRPYLPKKKECDICNITPS